MPWSSVIQQKWDGVMADWKDSTDTNKGVCTVDELLNIITAPAGGLILHPDTSYDKVYPRICLGDESIAIDLVQLRRMGITHIINAAYGTTEFHSHTEHERYNKINIKFLGVSAIDHMNCDISPYFESSAQFISDALEAKGKVLVHCIQGMSRSPSLVIAFLMIKKHMDVRDAVRLIRSHRNIMPNDGFLQQLCDLNLKLYNDRQTDDITQRI